MKIQEEKRKLMENVEKKYSEKNTEAHLTDLKERMAFLTIILKKRKSIVNTKS